MTLSPPMHITPNSLERESGFSLLELAIVLTIIGVIVGTSLSVSTVQVDQERVRNTWNELGIIKNALKAYAERHSALPCPAPLNVARSDANYGQPAPDCDITPTAGVTHTASPKMKTGGVPVYALGLAKAFIADDWGNRYVYSADDNLINPASLTFATDPALTLLDKNGNTITEDGAFVVYSVGASGLGGIADEDLATTSCSATQLDKENCGGTAGTFIDTPLMESDSDATFFDDLVVWTIRVGEITLP